MTVPETAVQPVLATTLSSIAFAWHDAPGAIALRDPATLDFLGTTPEWDASGRSVPAGFVGGTRPSVQVRFTRSGPDESLGTETVRVWAVGDHCPGIAETEIRLSFDASGQSPPYTLPLETPLPAGPGGTTLRWSWFLRGGVETRRLGDTEHEVLLAWRAPLPAADWAVWTTPSWKADGDQASGAGSWVYLPVMQWSCQWAAGANSPRAICDAILGRVAQSGLKYAVSAWSAGDMLRSGGGYCGGWYRMFQALAAAQGVPLMRRSFWTDWRTEGKAARWCAIVVEHPGVNLAEPTASASQFHDVDQRPLQTSPVITRTRPRYRFWGQPGGTADGHCINLLQDEGTWYLYDSCFATQAARLPGFHPPDPDLNVEVPVDDLGGFKAAYLDHAVTYMLGSLEHDGKMYVSSHPPPTPADQHPVPINGLTVLTALLPDRDASITFRWGP